MWDSRSGQRAVWLYLVGCIADVAITYYGLSTVEWVYERDWLTSVLLTHTDILPALIGAKVLFTLGLGLLAVLLPFDTNRVVQLLGVSYGCIFLFCAVHNVSVLLWRQPLIPF